MMVQTDLVSPAALPFLGLMKGNRAKTWTTIGGGILIFVVWQLALVVVILASPLARDLVIAGDVTRSAMDEAKGMAIFLLAGFGPAFIVIMAWRKLMERRRIATLFTGAKRFRWRLFFASALAVGFIALGLTLLFDTASMGEINARGAKFSAADWLILTLAYGVGISVQASFEEVYVRGWLLQHTARFIPNMLAAILVTALAFSALHAGHPGWATYVAAFLFGLAYGWSAYRLNGLEASMGAHIVNNLIGALLSGQMVSGNAPTMDASDFALYGAYVLGFLLFVEGWARFFEKPSRD